ncbi:MAG: septal ring lytic transglycosylase RlpA family protein [Hyphomicrobiaceae bacterium]
MRIVWRPTLVCCLALAAVAAGAGACSGSKPGNGGRYGPASPRLVDLHQPIPKGGGTYKVGAPYQIDGRWYLPQEDPSYDRTGLASYYAEDFHGRRTSNGEIFDMWALSAAHPTLPLPSLAYVTNVENGRTLLVRINDRGPYVKNRVIDLSRATARYLGVEGPGLARVRVRYAGPAPLSGDDRQEQRFLASRPWFQIKLARAPNDSR